MKSLKLVVITILLVGATSAVSAQRTVKVYPRHGCYNIIPTTTCGSQRSKFSFFQWCLVQSKRKKICCIRRSCWN